MVDQVSCRNCMFTNIQGSQINNNCVVNYPPIAYDPQVNTATTRDAGNTDLPYGPTPAPAVVNNIAGNQYNYFDFPRNKQAIFSALGIVGGVMGFAALIVYLIHH